MVHLTNASASDPATRHLHLLKQILNSTGKQLAEFIHGFKVHALSGFFVKQRDRIAIQASFPGHIDDLELVFAHQFS